MQLKDCLSSLRALALVFKMIFSVLTFSSSSWSALLSRSVLSCLAFNILFSVFTFSSSSRSEWLSCTVVDERLSRMFFKCFDRSQMIQLF